MKKKLPQPWYRPARGVWYVTLDGKQHNLGSDEEEAFKRYEQLLRSPKTIARKPTVSSGTVVGIIDRFLDWCSDNRSPETYEWYRWRLQLFVESIDKRLTVAQLRPYHLDDWLSQNREKKWSSGTKHGMCRAVQRAMRWAARKGHIDRSPIADYEKPSPGKRKVVISPSQFEHLLTFVKNPSFRDLLLVTWDTGARPQETLAVEARHVDLANARWVFPADEAKGEQWPRIVYLPDQALAITKRLLVRHPHGPLFRNVNDNAWTTDAVNCCFTAVQHRMGMAVLKQRQFCPTADAVQELVSKLKPTITSNGVSRQKTRSELEQEARRKLRYKAAKEHAPKYCLYHLRHSWLDGALKSGLDPLTCAILMGHRDPSTLVRHYQHLAQAPDYLRTAAQKAVSPLLKVVSA